MKIKELIDFLKKMPQEANVYTDLGDYLNHPWLHSVEDLEIEFIERRIDCNLKRVASLPCKETADCQKGIVLYVKKSI
jgi:hypothetical protein